MVSVMKLFGYTSKSLTADMKKVLDFEIKLAAISIPRYKLRQEDKLYKKMSMGELHKLVPEVGIFIYIFF